MEVSERLLWADYINDLMLPSVYDLRRNVFGRVLPTFTTLESEAKRVARRHWERLTTEPFFLGEPDFDARAARADALGADYLASHASIRQGMVNLFAVALYHLFEQQCYSLQRRIGGEGAPPSWLFDWFETVTGLPAAALQTEGMLELRLVANAAKHAEGRSARRLRDVAPELFTMPEIRGMGSHPQPTQNAVKEPLLGESIYVTDERLSLYFDEVIILWETVIQGLRA